MPDGSASAHLYRPKLATVLADGYDVGAFRKDAMAGLTVAVVALPLSMAIAVASGVSPERGLYAAVIGGFVVSALGGSRYQIGGPAGAFSVLVAATVVRFGVDGLLLTVALSGLMLALIGLLRLGSLIRYTPHAVAVGFTCGIAITILASQLRDLGGLKLAGAEPGPLLPKLAMLARALPTFSPAAFGVGAGSAALILVLRHWRPAWPGMLIAVVAASVAALLLRLPVDTLGSHFGGIPQGLPAPGLPTITLAGGTGCVPGRIIVHAAGWSGEPPFSEDRRRHDRAQTSLQHGVTGSRDREYGLGPFRRDQRDRNDRAHGDQHSRRGPQSDLGNLACRISPDLHACCRPSGEFHPARRSGWSAGGRVLEHGGKAGLSLASSSLAHRPGAPSHFRANGSGRSHRRHRRWMSARGGDRDHRSRQRSIEPPQGSPARC